MMLILDKFSKSWKNCNIACLRYVLLLLILKKDMYYYNSREGFSILVFTLSKYLYLAFVFLSIIQGNVVELKSLNTFL